MNDAGWGGSAPRGPSAGRREVRSIQQRVRLVESAAPPSSPGASNYCGSRTEAGPGGSWVRRGAPRQSKTRKRAAGGAGGRGDLAGVSGFGCEGGGAASLVELFGLEQRPGNKEGQAGVCWGTRIEGEILPAPEGVLRIFSRQQQALCLCLTRLKHLLQRSSEATNNPLTSCVAPPSSAWP